MRITATLLTALGALYLTAVVSCDSQRLRPPRKVSSRAAPSGSFRTPAPNAPPVPLRVQLVKHAPPSWLEPPNQSDNSVSDQGDPSAEVVAVGERAALVKVTVGLGLGKPKEITDPIEELERFFAVDRDRGVVGQLRLPRDTRWLGLGKKDRVLAATSRGRLYRSKNLDAACGHGGWTQVNRLPKATQWDAAAGLLLAATERHLFVSTDGGSSFRRTLLGMGKRAQITKFFTRYDGVIVAHLFRREADPTSEEWVRISRDAGRSWYDSPYSVGVSDYSLKRTGSWIHTRCGNTRVVLARDAKHWVWLREADFLPDEQVWKEMVDWSRNGDHFARVARPSTTASYPLPPIFEPALEVSDWTRGCVGGRLVTSTKGHGAGRVSISRKPLAMIRNTVGPIITSSRTMLRLLGDGLCAPSTTRHGGRCAPNMRHTRLPHAVIFDQHTANAAVKELPARCQPGATIDFSGLSLLLCAEPKRTRIYSIVRTGRWVDEGSLPVPTANLTEQFNAGGAMAIDGTVGLVPRCTKPDCAVFVRTSNQPAGPSRWRAVHIAGAIAYRILPAATVLGVVREQASNERRLLASFVLDGLASGRRTLVSGVPFEQSFANVMVDRQRLVVLLQKRGPETKQVTKMISTAGTLIDVEPDYNPWARAANEPE